MSATDPTSKTVTSGSILVRDSRGADLTDIWRIYAHHVEHGVATFEESAPTEVDLAGRRNAILARGLPFLVAEHDGAIAGFCYANAFRPRPAYENTVEDSAYVAPGLYGRGIGHALLAALITRCTEGRWRQMVAMIGGSDNAASIALHRRNGFRLTGVLEAVGFKHGNWVDVVVMQRALGHGNSAPPVRPI